jgi:hypothetical protein
VATIPTCPKCWCELKTITRVLTSTSTQTFFLTSTRTWMGPLTVVPQYYQPSHWICGECGHLLPRELEAWCNMVTKEQR